MESVGFWRRHDRSNGLAPQFYPSAEYLHGNKLPVSLINLKEKFYVKILTLDDPFNITGLGESGEVPMSRDCEKHRDPAARPLFRRCAGCAVFQGLSRYYSRDANSAVAE